LESLPGRWIISIESLQRLNSSDRMLKEHNQITRVGVWYVEVFYALTSAYNQEVEFQFDSNNITSSQVPIHSRTQPTS
jgi:hypothetical protein